MSADQAASASVSPSASIFAMSDADYKKLVTDTKAMENEICQGWRELTQTPQLVSKLQQEYRLAKAKHQRTLKRLRFESSLGVKEFPYSLRGTNPKLKRTHCARRVLAKKRVIPDPRPDDIPDPRPDDIPFYTYKIGTSDKTAGKWGPTWVPYDPELDGVVIKDGLIETTLQRNSETGEVEVTKVEKRAA